MRGPTQRCGRALHRAARRNGYGRAAVRGGLLSVCLLLLASCASYGRPLSEVAPEINSTYYTGPTIIEPGDVLEVRFARNADWNQTARVRSDGCLSLPVIGEVRVAGRTMPELQQLLNDSYRPVLVDPAVNVNVTEPPDTTSGDAGVVVFGEVINPGAIGLSGQRLTLVEALGRAGGQLKATAALGNTVLLRRSPQSGLYTGWLIDAREVNWGSAEPVYLQRHDLVFVPNTAIDDVNIWVDQYINRLLPLSLTSFALGIVVGNR